MKPVILPIEDALDLHTFQPKDVSQLMTDYISECLKAGIYSVRIIHGKGTGVLKQNVHRFLKQHPAVLEFKDAPPESGGWGATVVKLAKPSQKGITSPESA